MHAQCLAAWPMSACRCLADAPASVLLVCMHMQVQETEEEQQARLDAFARELEGEKSADEEDAS